jgi:hypothetical protein
MVISSANKVWGNSITESFYTTERLIFDASPLVQPTCFVRTVFAFVRAQMQPNAAFGKKFEVSQAHWPVC